MKTLITAIALSLLTANATAGDDWPEPGPIKWPFPKPTSLVAIDPLDSDNWPPIWPK